MTFTYKYYHFETTDSTNAFAKREISALKDNECFIISANAQTAGVGRLKRSWYSPQGKNLYLTLAFFSNLTPFAFSQLLSLILVEYLSTTGLEATIKWPNDVLVNRKKIAGILTETVASHNSVAIILGIGLNLNMSEAEMRSISQPATSIFKETALACDPVQARDFIVEKFFTALNHMSVAEIQQKWQEAVSWMIGEKRTINTLQKTYQGTISAFDPSGTLFLLQSDHLIPIYSGDIVE